jgi:hypothetical protein
VALLTRPRLRPLALGLLATFSLVRQTAAQEAPAPNAATKATFMARSDVSFLWARMVTPDRRFKWEGRVAFDLDLIAYRRGRLNFTGVYDAVLGDERREFDLNHGNYVFEMSASQRVQSVELAAVFHHVSRHLTDRDNQRAISWNTVAVRADRRFAISSSTVDARLELGHMGRQAFVDYQWTGELGLTLRRPLDDHTGLFASGSGSVIGLNSAIAHRSRVCGARLEGGLRVNGTRGAVELFAGYERRIDAFPTDRSRLRFWTVGFRLLS